MRECPSCRRPLADEARFCPQCGQSLDAARRRPPRPESKRERARPAAADRLAGLLALLLLGLLAALLWSRPGASPRPGPPAADLELAREAMAAGDWTGALRALSPSAEVPPVPEGRRLLAEALHELALSPSGERWYERAARARELSLADAPRDVAGLRARAELESALGEPARAAGWWQAALGEAAAADPPAPSLDSVLLDTAVAEAVAGERGRAELLLEELLERRPDDARALACRGLLQLDAGRLGLAEADLSRALELDPGLPQARAGLAETWRRQGQADRAREELGAGREAAAATLTGRHARALLAEARGERDAALRALDEALLLAPGDPRLLADRARLEATAQD